MHFKEKLATKLSALFIKIGRHHAGILLLRLPMVKPVNPAVIKRDRRTGCLRSNLVIGLVLLSLSQFKLKAFNGVDDDTTL